MYAECSYCNQEAKGAVISFYHDYCPLDFSPACEECGARYPGGPPHAEFMRPQDSFMRIHRKCPAHSSYDFYNIIYYRHNMDYCEICEKDLGDDEALVCKGCLQTS